jgi:hypothetical protein
MIRGGMNTRTQQMSWRIVCDACGASLTTYGHEQPTAILCAEAQDWVVNGKCACPGCAGHVIGEARAR